MPYNIVPTNKLEGEITLPGDKSISHRAIMLGALARGRTRARYVLDCDDCNCTIRAFKEMGIEIEKDEEWTVINGKGLKGLTKPKGPVNAGNSGTTMRLLAGILAGQSFEAALTGDASLSKRPMMRIVEPLRKMGVDIKAKGGEYPPLTIMGGNVKPIDYRMPVSSAQVKSAILLAGLYANGVTKVEEAFKSRDHTERMLKYFGAKIRVDGLAISLEGGKELEAKEFEVPGDISAASFFIAAASLLKNSKVRINRVSINPARAGILDILERMGAKVRVLNRRDDFEPVGDIEVESSPTRGIIIEEDLIPSIIDELPVIFVLAALSKGRTVIKGAKELKVKETDRIASMKENLEAMGGRFAVEGSDIAIEGVAGLNGARLKSFGDHRTCMAMTIAALAARKESAIDEVECVSKSFPEFFKVLENLKSEHR